MQADLWLFGSDPLPGIVSVHANLAGQVWVWRRVEGKVLCEQSRFRPWLFARDLRDTQGLPLSWDDPSAPFYVQERQGEVGSLKYLLTAADGRRLRERLVGNAARRLGRTFSGFHELDGYYTLSPVEQYLCQSGRTYFKGMSFDDPVRLQFDLETTSLTPQEGRIFMIAVRDNRGFEKVLEASAPDQEAGMIRELLSIIAERDPDIIENHNICAFDLPFLLGRAEALGIRVNLSRPQGPQGVWKVRDGRTSPHWACAGREILDTIDAVRRMDLPSQSLKVVSQLFGIAPEGRVYLEGEKIAQTYQEDPELVRRYALQDVEEVDALAKRVLASSFALAKMTPRPYYRLPYAGPAMGVLEPMLVRAYLHSDLALPAEQPRHTEPHSGGHVQLFAEGVLSHVVKADIASMYPSLIRTEGIGPKSDPLGVFLHLMDKLTVMRLEHKAAMRRGESGEHHAMQGAMKLIVNAGYGYLGAGRMALFGDRDAADRVTTRGREVLGQVVSGLQAGGVTLIEADTDGVYFSVPEGWSEAEERQLIAQVDATLPEGVSLEFDGRWAAMLSHEVKNYALLGYDGKLQLRGAAFDTVRSEPYGRAFLTQATTALLKGDVARVHEVYQSTLSALAQRTLTNREVATRIRLTKSPEDYARTRSQRKENQYEAMLSASQTWQAGTRVYLYRQQERGWQPLDLNPDGHDYDLWAYQQNLHDAYATRLRKGLSAEDFEQVFRQGNGQGLFDAPLEKLRSVYRLRND